MDRVYTLPLGRNLESAPGGSWQIGGIRVDNPSGSYLYIPNLREYVPPYTGGWERPFVPTTATITVRFSDSPSGSKGQLVGNPVTVTLYDTPVVYSEGFPTGSGARVNIIPIAQTAFAPVTAVHYGDVDAPATVLSAPAGQRLVITRLAVLPDLSFGLAGSDPFLVIVQVLWDIFPALTWSWYQTVSPENPYRTEKMDEGSIVLVPGQGLRVRAYAEDQFTMLDTGTAGLIAEAQYYTENA